MKLSPWIDPENFNPNYLMRSMHLLPRRGDKPQWQHTQDYWHEKDALPAIDLDGREFMYEGFEDTDVAASKFAMRPIAGVFDVKGNGDARP